MIFIFSMNSCKYYDSKVSEIGNLFKNYDVKVAKTTILYQILISILLKATKGKKHVLYCKVYFAWKLMSIMLGGHVVHQESPFCSFGYMILQQTFVKLFLFVCQKGVFYRHFLFWIEIMFQAQFSHNNISLLFTCSFSSKTNCCRPHKLKHF